MAKCEWCGRNFDREDAADEFDQEYIGWILSYSCFKPTLCYECACQAIEDEVDGVYFETCEECGTTFDFITEKSDFERRFPSYNGTTLTDYWDESHKYLCADCAMEYV